MFKTCDSESSSNACPNKFIDVYLVKDALEVQW